MALCTPEQNGVAATDRLLRPAFGLYRLEWPDEPGVEFHLSQAIGSGFCAGRVSRLRTCRSAPY